MTAKQVAFLPNMVIMGVSGSGKSTLGRRIAADLGLAFQEGDDFHSPQNVARMQAGLPLRDQDRAPWLDSIGDYLRQRREMGAPAVVTCSALKVVYRERLALADPGLLWIFLEIDKDQAAHRVAARKGHYMPASLVDSQFEALEAPQSGPNVLRLKAGPLEDLVAAVRSRLSGHTDHDRQ
jgi:gluconokinase